MRKSYIKQERQIIVEKEEAKQIEEFSSSEKKPKNKDLNSSFRNSKKGFYSK